MLRKFLLLCACLLMAFAPMPASSETSNFAKLRLQLAQMRASIVDKDEKTKHVAHTEAGFALVAVSEAELRLSKLATDGSDDHMAEFDAAMTDVRTAVRQFLDAAKSVPD